MTLKVEKGKEERRRIFYQPSHTTEFSSILVSHYLNPVFFERDRESEKPAVTFCKNDRFGLI